MITLVQQSIGAQLLAEGCLFSGTPLFYLSPIVLDHSPRRGGVPVVFPQFAKRGILPKHGFIRNLPWQCIQERHNHQVYQSHYQIEISAEYCKDWPHQATLDLRVNFTDTQCEIELQIFNAGHSAFTWTGGLHPYFYIDDLLSTQILGLHLVHCEDRFDNSIKYDPDRSLQLSGTVFERLYLSSPKLEVICHGQHLIIECSGFTQWMIWNPGAHSEGQLVDLPVGDWRHFVCIEPVIASQESRLDPGKVFCGKLLITHPPKR